MTCDIAKSRSLSTSRARHTAAGKKKRGTAFGMTVCSWRNSTTAAPLKPWLQGLKPLLCGPCDGGTEAPPFQIIGATRD